MTHKKKVRFLFLATISVLILSIVVSENPVVFGLCASTYVDHTGCFREKELMSLVIFAGFFSIVLLPLLFTLYFTHPSAFKIWKKVTIWFLSIVTGFWFIDTFMDYWVGGAGGGGGMMGGGAIIDGSFLIYALYFVVSVIVILRTHFREKRLGKIE